MPNSPFSSMPILCKLYRCFGHGLTMCMWFGYNPQVIFVNCFASNVFWSWFEDVHVFWIYASYNFCHFLAHMSRMLIGKLIVYAGIHRSSVVHLSNDISSEAIKRPILSILHI